MKYLLFIFLFGCTASAQKQSEDIKDDIEFQKLMNKVTETNDLSVQVQAKASKKEAELVTKAVATIVSMKGEIKDLKIELNEVKSKLDSVTIDTGGKFVLLPISNN
jgi:acetyl-CoA carboxylase beta subunit